MGKLVIVYDLDDHILYMLRVRYFFKSEMVCAAGSLHFDVAVIHHGGDRPYYFYGNVLDIADAEFRNVSFEKTFLGAVYDSHVGDKPRIEGVHHERIEEYEPADHDESAPDEGEEGNEAVTDNDLPEYHEYKYRSYADKDKYQESAEHCVPVSVKE